MNYVVKIQVANDEFIHVRIFKPLPYTNCPPSVSDYQEGKTIEDTL